MSKILLWCSSVIASRGYYFVSIHQACNIKDKSFKTSIIKISKDEKEDMSEVNIIRNNYPDLGIYYVNQSYLIVRKLRT